MNVPASGGDKKNIVKMAYIYFQEGRWDKAIEEYKKLIALDPEDINTHNMLGDVYVKKGAVREAFDEYIKVSTDFSARGQTEKSVIVNKKLAALDSSSLPPESQKRQNLIKQTIKAESAIEQGDIDSAIEALKEVISLDPENLAAYANLGELFEKKGLAAEAVKEYQVLGTNFLNHRLYKKAQEMFQKVVQLEPNNIEGRSNLAQIFIKQGSESDAKKEYLIIAELALNQNDLEKAYQYGLKAVEFKSIEAHYVLGLVYYKKQQYSEAKSEFESLLRFKVNHIGALVHLARVQMEQNQFDKASENIQKALKVDKENLLAIEALAEVSLKKSGSKNEAITAFGVLVEKYEAKNDFKKALEFAKNRASLDENNAAFREKLGELLKINGDKDGAVEAFSKAIPIYEKQQKKDKVQELARKILELNPDHTETQKMVVGAVVDKAQAPAEPPKAPAETKAPVEIKPAASSGVMDLEKEAEKPQASSERTSPPPVEAVTPPPEPAKSTVIELDTSDDWKAELSIADNFVKQGMVEEAIEIYQHLVETFPDKPEIKEKLNLAYTAYVKTGEDVIGAIEAEKKVKEEEEKVLRAEMEKKAHDEAKRLRAEMEQKAKVEAEARAKTELERKAREEAELKAKMEIERIARESAEKKAREEAEKKAKEEMERMAKEEADRKIKEELERKIREELETKVKEEAEKKAKEEAERKAKEEIEKRAKEEAEKKAKEEAERKAREEAEKKAKEEAEKKAREEAERSVKKVEPLVDLKSMSMESSSKGDSLVEEGKDEFMTIAVADIYTRQGLYEEASKIYKRILQLEPDNLEAKKKWDDLQSLLKTKNPAPAAPVTSAPTPPTIEKVPEPTPKEEKNAPEPAKDSSGKKKSNRVGYV